MKLILARSFYEATRIAKGDLDLSRTEWRYVQTGADLRGYEDGTELYVSDRWTDGGRSVGEREDIRQHIRTGRFVSVPVDPAQV